MDLIWRTNIHTRILDIGILEEYKHMHKGVSTDKKFAAAPPPPPNILWNPPIKIPLSPEIILGIYLNQNAVYMQVPATQSCIPN